MSYDISLNADLGGPYPISLGILNENYTYNLGEFFAWFLGEGLTSFNGKEAWFLKEAIESGYEKLRGGYKVEPATLDFLKSFEPENKWGSVPGSLAFLSRVYKACIMAPNATVGVG